MEKFPTTYLNDFTWPSFQKFSHQHYFKIKNSNYLPNPVCNMCRSNRLCLLTTYQRDYCHVLKVFPRTESKRIEKFKQIENEINKKIQKEKTITDKKMLEENNKNDEEGKQIQQAIPNDNQEDHTKTEIEQAPEKAVVNNRDPGITRNRNITNYKLDRDAKHLEVFYTNKHFLSDTRSARADIEKSKISKDITAPSKDQKERVN